MTLREELGDALRGLSRRPAQSLWAAALLALAIGANGALFLVADAVLLRPLPYARPGELAWIWSTRVDREHAFFSLPDALAFRERAHTLRSFVAFHDWNPTLLGAGDPERLAGVRLTADGHAALGLSAQLGRTLQPQDDDPHAEPVVVLSDSLWRNRFGGDARLVGTHLLLDGVQRTVVGVLQPGIAFPGAASQVMAPLSPATHPRLNDLGTNFLRAVGRLAPGVSLQQARAELSAITAQLVREHPVDNAKKTAPLVAPLQDELTAGYRAPLWALLAAVALLLLIACFNLGNLLLARALAQRHDLAVRAALGATPFELARRAGWEVLLLALAGGALGLLLAAWGSDALIALAPSDLPLAQPPHLGARLAACIALCTTFAAAIAAVAPASMARRTSAAAALGAGHTTATRRQVRLRAAAVVAEIALSCALLAAAGLLSRSLARVLAEPPGFATEGATAMRIALPPDRYASPAAIARFAEEATRRIAGLPGLPAAGLVSVLPLTGINVRTDFIVVGHEPASVSDAPAAQNRAASPGYFQAAGIPLLAGRGFEATDDARARPVAVVDEPFARRYAGVGAQLLLDDNGSGPPRGVTVVGVVGGVHHDGLDQPATPTIYCPLAQAPPISVAFLAPRLFLVVRGPASPDVIAREIAAVDRGVPVFERRTLSQRVALAVAPRRFVVTVLIAFACAALLLATLGVAALVSSSVTEQTRELGLRRALGAQAGDLLALVLGRSARLCLIGLGAGTLLAAALQRLFASMLFGVGAADPLTWSGIAAVMLASVLLASALPARRALKVDPAVALRGV